MSIQKFVPTSSHGGMVAVVSNDYSNAYVQYEDYAALQEKLDALREKVLSAIPSNWCDPMLTGDGSALGKAPWGCPEIERLLLGIRERIAALTDQGRAGEGRSDG